MIQLNALMVAKWLGVQDAEAVELIASFLLKLQEAPDKSRFLKEAIRRALVEPDRGSRRIR